MIHLSKYVVLAQPVLLHGPLASSNESSSNARLAVLPFYAQVLDDGPRTCRLLSLSLIVILELDRCGAMSNLSLMTSQQPIISGRIGGGVRE